VLTPFFWISAFERAIKSAAQSALLVIGADKLDALAADWQMVASFAGGGALLSLLTSLASTKVGDEESPSVV
jgi:hypothetical protein